MPADDPDVYYICVPTGTRPVPTPVAFVTFQEFLADEPGCKVLWDLVATQFRTRSKFLAIWRGVSFVAVHRNAAGAVDGFLLISAPVNWQIDYVVVAPESRGQGIASALVAATANEAAARGVPYVMLTSRASLRPLYEACGFMVIPTTKN
jgi:ribosomal protein S18 acetylase RimI-like enzyme